jgi:hypothetical protein
LRPYLKNKLKQKGLGVWSKWSSACLASASPQFKPQYTSPAKKRERKYTYTQNIHICNGILFSHKNEILSFTATWMELTGGHKVK